LRIYKKDVYLCTQLGQTLIDSYALSNIKTVLCYKMKRMELAFNISYR